MKVTINECQPTGWEERPKEYTFDELKYIFEENSVVGQLLIKCDILREGLERIAYGALEPAYCYSQGKMMKDIAREALQRAGGGECAPRYPWHPTEDDYRAGGGK